MSLQNICKIKLSDNVTNTIIVMFFYSTVKGELRQTMNL